MLKKTAIILLSLVILTIGISFSACTDGDDTSKYESSMYYSSSEATFESSYISEETSDILSEESEFNNASIGDNESGIFSDIVSDIVSDIAG